MRIQRNRRAAGRALLACAVLAGLPAVTLAAAHPTAATALFVRVQSAVKCATTAACVSGTNKSAGPGVAGTSSSGYGVTGATLYNATSISNATYGVGGYDQSTNGNAFNSGVFGTSAAGSGVYGTSTGGPGVQGYSASDAGVYGHTSTGIGLYGIGANDGVYGISLDSDGVGGTTESSNAAGVTGTSETGEGGYFQTTATTALQAVNANTTNPMTSTAITATTNGDSVNLFNSTRAVLGSNANGDGGEFAGSYIGLIGRAPTTGFPLDLVDENDNDLFLVDGLGNATVAANLTVLGTINGQARMPGGSRVSAFVAKTAAPTIEDTGTAQLSAGAAAVRLDPVFAGSIDSRQSYRVFVTPDGDTNGLYVAAKTASGFVVREIHGGRSTLSFDYRIVATAWGESGKRAAIMTGSPMAARVLSVRMPKPRTAAQLKVPPHP